MIYKWQSLNNPKCNNPWVSLMWINSWIRLISLKSHFYIGFLVVNRRKISSDEKHTQKTKTESIILYFYNNYQNPNHLQLCQF